MSEPKNREAYDRVRNARNSTVACVLVKSYLIPSTVTLHVPTYDFGTAPIPLPNDDIEFVIEDEPPAYAWKPFLLEPLAFFGDDEGHHYAKLHVSYEGPIVGPRPKENETGEITIVITDTSGDEPVLIDRSEHVPTFYLDIDILVPRAASP